MAKTNKNPTPFFKRKTTLAPLFAVSAMTAIVAPDFIDPYSAPPDSHSNVAQTPAPDAAQTPPVDTAQTPAPDTLQPPPANSLPPHAPNVVELPPPPPPPPPSPANDPFSLDPEGNNNFLFQLGISESGNKYPTKNFAGCVGRWQFCPVSVGGPGFGKYNNNPQGWANDPAYQNEQMEAYTRNHWNEIVRLGLTRFVGQRRGSFTITPAGLLGGSHLVGIGRLQQFLERGIDSPDGGGTRPSTYMARFANTLIPDDWIRMPDGKPATALRGPAV